MNEEIKTYPQILQEYQDLMLRLDKAERAIENNTEKMNKLLTDTIMDKITKLSTVTTDLEVAKEVMNEAKKHNLEAEVFAFAIIAMRNHPEMTIQEAMVAGLEEWIK